MLKGIIIMDDVFTNDVYPQYLQDEIKKHVEMVSEPITKKTMAKDLSILNEVDVIFSGWGGPHFDKEVLEAAFNLKIVFYGAGSIKKIVSNDFWDQGIRITTANAANAIPVAEYTLACTILGLKNAVSMNNRINQSKEYPKAGTRNIIGGFNAKIGLISLGAIARYTLDLYRKFDYEIIVYDPFLSDEEAKSLNVKKVELDVLFKESDVVSLHTPLLDSTKGMINKKHFLSMKPNTTFINTARGAVVNEPQMIEALKERIDITAFLDVVYPEPPSVDSPLYEMKNIFLTPHIAGSEGGEVARMGNLMLNEFKLFLKGEKLHFEVSKDEFERMA